MVRLTSLGTRLLARLAKTEVAVRPWNYAASELRQAGYAEYNGEAGRGTWWLAITPAGRTAIGDEK